MSKLAKNMETADFVTFNGDFLGFYADCEISNGSLKIPDGGEHLLTSLRPINSVDGRRRYAMVADQIAFTDSAVFAAERKRMVLSSVLKAHNETSNMMRYIFAGAIIMLLYFSYNNASKANDSAKAAQSDAKRSYETALEIKLQVEQVQTRLSQPIIVQGK